MKEYLVIFAQLLCVGWILRTLAQARGKVEDEQLGWFDIRESGKAPKAPKKPPVPPAGTKPLAASKPAATGGTGASAGRGPHA